MRLNNKHLILSLTALLGAGAAHAEGMTWGGHIEAGYLFQTKASDAGKNNNTFFAREACLHTNFKAGKHEGYVEFAAASANAATHYGYNWGPGAAVGYALGVRELNMTFHPEFLGEASEGGWKWGLMTSPFGYEGATNANNVLLSRSFNFAMTPSHVIGTALSKNLGMLGVSLYAVNSLTGGNGAAATAVTHDFNAAPSVVASLTAGSKEGMMAKVNFGWGFERAVENKDPAMFIDAVATIGAVQNLAANVEFTMAKKDVGGTSNSAWAISVFADYSLMDNAGVALRFDYLADSKGIQPTKARTAAGKDMAVTLGYHYEMTKGLVGKFEYSMLMPKNDTGATLKSQHMVAWAAQMSF